MLRLAYVCALALFVAPAADAASRITFERTVPARQSLAGAEDLVVTYAIGDNAKITTFLDVFIDQANRGEILRVIDPRAVERSTERSHRWRKKPKYALNQTFRADAYLRIVSFTCRTTEKTGQGSSYDFNGDRVRREQHWIDSTCIAKIDVLGPDSKTKVTEVSAHGEGTSQRVEEITDEDRDTAMDQAARYAAVSAAEEIRPRRVRETISLVEDAPQFAEGMAMIESERTGEARKVWESALASNRASAGLQFNLGAVCEALADIPAADLHYSAAQALAPKESRYKYEYEMFRRRAGVKRR